jgi:hypothetical protein
MVQTRAVVALFAVVALAACSNQLTVNGTVVDQFGLPWPGQPVIISAGSFTQSTVSSSSGTFTVANVPTPYNATVIDSTSTAFATVYMGLTRADPTLSIGNAQILKRSGGIGGHLTGGSYPEPPGYSTELVFASPQVAPEFPQTEFLDDSSGGYSGAINWGGPASTTGTLYVLQVHFDGGLPVDYPGYGTLSGLTLEDKSVLPNQNVTLSPVTTGSLSVTVSVPQDYTFEFQAAFFQPAPGVSFSNFWGVSGGPASFVYATPSIPGTSLMVRASASVGDGIGVPTSFAQQQVAPGTSNLMLNLPAAPSPTLPADGATGVTDATSFAWTGFPGVVYAVLFNGHDLNEGVLVYVEGTTATFPNIADAGFPLQGNYTWQVTGIAPVASIDALAAAGGTWALTFGDLMEATSGQQSFSTSP